MSKLPLFGFFLLSCQEGGKTFICSTSSHVKRREEKYLHDNSSFGFNIIRVRVSNPEGKEQGGWVNKVFQWVSDMQHEPLCSNSYPVTMIPQTLISHQLARASQSLSSLIYKAGRTVFICWIIGKIKWDNVCEVFASTFPSPHTLAHTS